MRSDRKKSKAGRVGRRIFRWVVLLSILGAAGWFGFLFLGRALCLIAIGQIAELTNTRIETGSVDFRSNGSVFIEKLVISPYKEAEPGQVILRAEKVHARFDVGSLLLLRPVLRQIDVNDFTFNAQYDLDTGKWNLSTLKIKAPKGTSGKIPLIHLERGTLQYSKISGGEVKVAASVPLTASFEFDEVMQRGYRFDLKTATQAGGFGESYLRGTWEPGLLTIAGGIASADVPALEMAWTIDVIAAVFKYDANDAFSLDLRIKKLNSKLSPPLDRFVLMGPSFLEKSAPFAAVRKVFRRYSPSGLVNIRLDVSGNFKRLGESLLSGYVDCNDVSIVSANFLYPIEHLKGRIDFTKNGVRLNNLSGRHGDVELSLNGWTRGFAEDLQYDLRVSSENMALDEDLYNALSVERKKFWSMFSPSGRAGVDYRLTRASAEAAATHLVLDLHGVDGVYRRFPYPLKNLTGKVSFEPGRTLISDVVSQADGRRIAIDGAVLGRGDDRRSYDVSIKVENIPLDATLEAALPARQRDLYRQFNPSGVTSGEVKVSRGAGAEDAATFKADLSFKDGSLKSEELLLPVTEVTAGAVFEPNLITIKDLSGRYGGNPVSLSGRIWPGDNDGSSRYELDLKFAESALNDDLFDLLPKSARKIVREFEPKGKIGLTVHLKKDDGSESPDYKVMVKCLGNSVNLPQFAYPLKDITGTLVISPESIEFKDINSVPGDSVPVRLNTAYIKLDGRVMLAENAFAGAVFAIDAKDIFFDERLGAALPAGIRRFHDKLLYPSRFDLKLDEVRITPGEDGERLIDINGLLRLENCTLQIAGANMEMDAELNINGLYKTGRGFESCHIFLDGRRFGILGKSFTDVRADIYYDKDRRTWRSENLGADCYDGKLTGKLELRQPEDSPLEYVLQTGFRDVDLKKFLSDTRMKGGSEQDRTTGKMSGSLNVQALVGDSSTRIGTCKLSISDMQVGRLSPVAKLLTVLRFAEPTEFAFDQMFVDSYIKRNDLIVRKLDLSGRSVAFYGSGEMDLQTRNVNLDLTARGHRQATSDPSVLGSLLEGLGQAVIRIEVTGDFYDPQVTTRTLPFLKGPP